MPVFGSLDAVYIAPDRIHPQVLEGPAHLLGCALNPREVIGGDSQLQMFGSLALSCMQSHLQGEYGRPVDWSSSTKID